LPCRCAPSHKWRIKAAYDHLAKEGGIGKQKNQKYDEVKLLEDHRFDDAGHGDDLFMARLIAVMAIVASRFR